MLDHILVDVITQTRAAPWRTPSCSDRRWRNASRSTSSWATCPGRRRTRSRARRSPPGSGPTCRVDWPTWSQSAYRSWSIGEPPEDLPEVVLEITLRLQRLATMPDLDAVLACLPEESPAIGADTLVRAAPVVEQVHEPGRAPASPSRPPTRGPSGLDEARPERRLDTWPARSGSWAVGWPRSSSAWATSSLAYLPPEPTHGRRRATEPHRATRADRGPRSRGSQSDRRPPPVAGDRPEAGPRVGDDLGRTQPTETGRSARGPCRG